MLNTRTENMSGSLLKFAAVMAAMTGLALADSATDDMGTVVGIDLGTTYSW